MSNVIFQRDLGTLLQKSERIEKVATGFAKASGASDELLAAVARSAQLCKADLVAGVVEEFPELQGVMGRRYSSSESELVREALEEHYWPLTSQSRLPKNKAAQFIALGDRLDTMTGIIGIGKLPKGSADPFALRRAAVAVVRICMERGIDISLSSLVKDAAAAHHAELKSDTVDETIEFIKGRARGVLENIFDGLGRDVAGAVLAADSDNLPALRERTQAIYDLKRQDAEGFAKLAAVFKRVNNVLRQAHDDKIDTPAGLEHVVVNESEHENALIEGVKALIGTEEKGYGERAKVLSTLWPLLSVYFDNVMVRHDDEKIRNSRLSLMATIQRSIQDLADFTMIHAD